MTKHAEDLPPDTADKLRRMQEIRIETDSLQEEYDTLREEVVTPADALTEPEFIIGVDGRKYRVTKVAGSQPVYNYAALADLTLEQQAAITDVKVSATKLKQAITLGVVEAEEALKVVTYKPKKPYPEFNLCE